MRTPYLLLLVGLGLFGPPSRSGAADQPNILWITSEDNGPHLGCYGDAFATTPNLDALGRRGMIYRNAWSTAPVCAPARTTLISGLYPSSTGGEHMRSETQLPPGAKMYPQWLREAGYYCSNRSKTDYNLTERGIVWDESSGKAHYSNRAEGQPFFAIFNFTTTHESQIRKRPHTPVHSAAEVRVPAYHPDRPEVRQDWAQYYDKMTEMDAQAGAVLRELDEAGLAEDTIVFYYGDHGSGMPRSKRCAYDSGLRVPLLVYVPPRWRDLAGPAYQPAGEAERLVAFVDFAPTVLSLVGIRPPTIMQGRAFLGPYTAPAPKYLYGLRGRMDERMDMVRSVFDGRYVYIRNYYPHRPWGQHVAYMFETPTTRVWKEMFDHGELTPEQAAFWQPKAPEELYDLWEDPDEVRNLADLPESGKILRRLRQANLEHVLAIRDVGYLPEGEIHSRSGHDTPYEMARDPDRYPMQAIVEMAELASSRNLTDLPALTVGLDADDSAVRFWAAMGLLIRGEPAVEVAVPALREATEDPSPYVRIVAAEALGRFGGSADVERSLKVLMALANAKTNGAYLATAALNALDAMGSRIDQVRPAIAALPKSDPNAPKRAAGYPGRLVQTLAEPER